MTDKYHLAFMILLMCIVTPRVSAQLPELSLQTLEAYQQAIEPTGNETNFLKINWYSQLRESVSKAYQSDKPLLIYMMNGHPLACT